jgi:hypothetical protein
MSPLVHGRYPVYSAGQVASGNIAGSLQTNRPVRSNLELTEFFGGTQVDTASLGGTTTGVYVSTICPVDVGCTYSTVSVLIGATAASTPAHGYAALYSGTAVTAPPLIGHSLDQLTAAMTASTRFDYTLASPATITPAQAPYGYVNVAIVSTVTTTVASAVTVPVLSIAATNYAWFTGTPKGQYLAQTASAAASMAPTTLANTATLSVAPVVWFW